MNKKKEKNPPKIFKKNKSPYLPICLYIARTVSALPSILVFLRSVWLFALTFEAVLRANSIDSKISWSSLHFIALYSRANPCFLVAAPHSPPPPPPKAEGGGAGMWFMYGCTMYIERTSIAIECTKCTIVLHWTAMSSRVCLEEFY
jgi:hypothetical protein